MHPLIALAGSPTFGEANQRDVRRRARGLLGGLSVLGVRVEPDVDLRVDTLSKALLRVELLLGRAAMLGERAGGGERWGGGDVDAAGGVGRWAGGWDAWHAPNSAEPISAAQLASVSLQVAACYVLVHGIVASASAALLLLPAPLQSLP